MGNVDVHQLRVFLAVYMNRSFSRAAELLNLSQPTVSDHVRNLETHLGCSLFDRMGRTILPTPEAEQLVPRAAEIIDKIDAIPDALRTPERELAGEIVMGCSTIPGTYWLPEQLVGFRAAHPGVRFEVRIGDSRKILQNVATHDYILGVIGAKMEASIVDFRSVAQDELVLAVPSTSSLPASISAGELSELPFLLRENGSGTRRVMETAFAERGVHLRDLRVAAILGSTEAVREAIVGGLGCSIISRRAVSADLAGGRLRVVAVQGMTIVRAFSLIRHRKRTLPPLYRAVYDFLSTPRKG